MSCSHFISKAVGGGKDVVLVDDRTNARVGEILFGVVLLHEYDLHLWAGDVKGETHVACRKKLQNP